MPTKYRYETLHSLPSVRPTVAAMEAAIAADLDEGGEFEITYPEVLGVPAVYFTGHFISHAAEWSGSAAVTTGIQRDLDVRSPAGLLLLAVDDKTYGLSFGQGHRLIPEHLKEQRFGLRFALRMVDASDVLGCVRRALASRGRTDDTRTPNGLPIWCVGADESADIFGRLSGYIDAQELTYARETGGRVKIEGAHGLRMYFGVEPRDFVADIRFVRNVLETRKPLPALEFIEKIRPVADETTLVQLRAELEEMLGARPHEVSDRLHPVVPMNRVPLLSQTRSYGVRIGPGGNPLYEHIELAHILDRTWVRPAGERSSALDQGKISLYGDSSGEEFLGGTKAIKWLEASVSIGTRRYVLMDGEWYEIGHRYLDAVQSYLNGLISSPATVGLPTWKVGWEERTYNAHAQQASSMNLLCLDRKGVKTRLHTHNGVEICDLLGPNGELIHVKKASGSSPLSHLFGQGLVSAQTLLASPEALKELNERIVAIDPGRRLPPTFRPKKVIFAILLKHGEELSPKTLFPFSQVTLVSVAKLLRREEIDVEVIGIKMAH